MRALIISFRMDSFFQRINVRMILLFIGAIFLLVLFYIGLFFSNVYQATALPQTASSTFPFANGNVSEIIRGPDGLFYLGGSFTYLGNHTGCTVPVNKTNFAPLLGFSKFSLTGSCTIYAIIPDGSSGWYVGGSFSDVARDTSYKGVVHVLSTGQLDTSFTSPNLGSPSVYALALDTVHNVLFIGGSWFGAEGDRLGLTAVNASTGSFLEWYANVSDFSNVRSLKLSGNTLYVGGAFTSVAGFSRNNLAAIDITNILTDTTGMVNSWDPSVSGNVYAIDVDTETNSVYAGGTFISVGGDMRNYLAEISLTSGSSTAWNPNPSSFIDSLKIDSGTNNIFVAGRFSTMGSDGREGIAEVDRTSGSVTSWNANLAGGNVSTIVLDGTKIYLGGSFTSVNSVSQAKFAVLDKATAALDTTVTASASSDIGTMALNGSSLYVGGSFISFGGVGRNRLAAVDPISGQVTSWDPSANGSVYALATDGSHIYAGGSFSTIGGTTRNKIASIGLDGSLDSWNPNISGGDVKEITVNSDSVYAGGTFDTVGSDAHRNIVKIDKSTGVATAWDPNLTGGWSGVMAIALDSTTAYIGGGFTSVGVETRNYLAAVDLSTGAPTSWNPNMNGDVTVMNLGTSTLFAGGNFTTVGADNRNKVAEVDLTSGLATSWDPNLGMTNNFKSIALTTTTVFLAGDFNSIGGDTAYSKIGAVNRYSGSLITGWHPNFDMGMTQTPYVLFYFDGMLAIGGSFNSVDGYSGNSKFAFYGPTTVGFVSSTTGNGTTIYNVSEGVTSGALTVGLLNGVTSTQDVVVDYAVTGGTASAFGIDYTLASGVATITAGNSTTSLPISVVDDETVESDETVVVTLSNPQDAGLSGDYNFATYTIVNNDVAPPGVTVSETLGSTEVTEGGGTDTYSVVLNSAPLSRVTIDLASSGGNQLSLSTSSIEFSTTSWNTPVTVTVTAVDDDIAEGDYFSTITHTATSADAGYNGVGITSVRTAITDNGDTAGVTKTESAGGTAVSEAGLSDSYTLVLTSQPTSTVTVAVASASSDISLSTSSIAFTSSNWNVAVTVTVSAVNDTSVEGSETATITHTVSSNNWNYNGISVGAVTVTISDNDTASQENSNSGGGTSSASRSITPPTLPEVVLPPSPPQAKEFVLDAKAQVPFSVGNESHTVELLSFTDKNVSFILHSEPLRVTIVKDAPYQVDTDKNGTPDILVEYIGIENSVPKVRITSLIDENELGKAVTINKGAYKTSSTQVNLSFNNVNGVSQVAISNNSNFEGSIFVPYQPSLPWKLTGGVGEKTVYVRFLSSSGGMIDSSDTIQYDPLNQYDPVKDFEKKEQEKSQKKPYNCPLTEGKAYKSAGSSSVYYIVGENDDDKVMDSPVCTKRPFKDSTLFFTYFDSYTDIQIVDKAVLDSVPLDKVDFLPVGPKAGMKSGDLVKKITNSKVYVVIGSSLNWIETEKVFTTLGFAFNMVQDISHSLYTQFSEGKKIGSEIELPEGAVIQYRGDVNVYRLDMDKSFVPPILMKRKITNPETLKKLYRTDRIIQLNPTQVYPDGSDIK